jgi:hypothetical protein
MKINNLFNMKILKHFTLFKNKVNTNYLPVMRRFHVDIEKNKLPFNLNSINLMTNLFFKKGNYYSTSKYKVPFSQIGKYYDYYIYIIDNVDSLNEENLDLLIKSLCLYEHKDEKTNFILNSYLNKSEDKFKAASTILYAYCKLYLEDTKLLKECISIIEQNDFSLKYKYNIMQIASTLSDMSYNNQIISKKIDEFIIINYASLEETDITILFRHYNMFSIKDKLEILNYLARRTIETISEFSLDSIILLSKSLSKTNFKHIVLLGNIRLRFENIIHENIKNRLEDLDNRNNLSADKFAIMLDYLVRLDFLEPADYLSLENRCFIFAAKQGINKDSAYIMFTTHCRFMRRIIVEERQAGQDIKVELPVLRRYK